MRQFFHRAEFPPPFAGPEEDPNPTIFQWAKNRRSWVHLSAFLLFSTLIHGSGFYLFQVVYPSPSRELPRAETISLLDPSDPSVRSLLLRISDRLTFLESPSEELDIRISGEDLAVRFTPSFQTTQMSPVELAFPWSMPPSLGRIAPRALSETGEPSAVSDVVMTPQGELVHREMAPWSILEDYLALAEEIPPMRIRLLVDAEGRVTVEEFDSSLDAGTEEGIKQVVESTLRYLPADASSSGWLGIRTKD
ncbi:MAG: hypothetical protein AAF733_00535 [Verrucomicrobiota bacterium]